MDRVFKPNNGKQGRPCWIKSAMLFPPQPRFMMFRAPPAFRQPPPAGVPKEPRFALRAWHRFGKKIRRFNEFYFDTMGLLIFLAKPPFFQLLDSATRSAFAERRRRN